MTGWQEFLKKPWRKMEKPVFKRDIKELIEIVNATYREFNGHLNPQKLGEFSHVNSYHGILNEYTNREILNTIKKRFKETRKRD